MKIEEAISYLRMATDEAGNKEFSDEYKEMCSMSIKALEKQIPKQPKEVKGQYDTYKPVCPVCGNDFLGEYCDECGQKID